MNEELAIVEGIQIGIRDTNKCICWFTTKTIHGCALQVISLEELSKEIERLSIYKLEDLNNTACIIIREDNIIRFKEFYR